MRSSIALRRCRYIKYKYRNNFRSLFIRVASMLIAAIFIFLCKCLLIPAFQEAACSDARDILYSNIDNYIISVVYDNLREVTVEDIINQQPNFSQKSHSVVVNSIYLNELCTRISKDILNKLNSSETITIPVHISKFLGLGFIYNGGPSIYMKLTPNYIVNMSYLTSVTSTGGSRTRYQVILKTTVYATLGSNYIRQNITVDRQFIICEVLY